MLRQTTSLRLTLTFLLPVIAASHADAANPLKEAKEMLGKTAAEVRKDFAKEAKLLRKILETEIDTVDGKLKGGQGGLGRVYEVYDALKIFQVGMHNEIREATEEFRAGTSVALGILQDAGIAVEDRPSDFFFGGQGISDDLNDDMIGEIRAVYAKVGKRLRKTRKLFANEADWCFNYRLGEPTEYLEWIASPYGGSAHSGRTLTIDIAIGASDRTVDDDALLLFSGSCSSSDGSLVATVVHQSGFYTIPTISVGQDDRWSHTVTDKNEGNYSFGIRAPSVIVGGDYAAIGAD